MAKKAHLGKGIEALIPGASLDSLSGTPDSFMELEVASIDPNPFQPRIIFDEESFEELKRSIEENGVIQPILVRPTSNGRYQVVAGERRLRACIEVGKKVIPAYVKEITTDEEMLEIALVENVQREQLNPIDLAKGYQQLMDECGLTQEEVAKKIGKDRSTVTNILRLLKLPPKIQESLQQGEIKEGHARALLGVSDSKEQERIWRKTVKNSLSVREVERLVRKHQEKHKDKPLKPLRPRKAAYYNKLESRLREKLGTQVKIRPRKDGGTIEISYFSPEDLERLMEIFDTLNF